MSLETEADMSVRVPAERLRRFCEAVLRANGLPAEEAHIVADSLLYANLAGYDSHGVFKLSAYLAKLKNGTCRPGVSFDIVTEQGAVGVADARHAAGPVAGVKAMEWVVARARVYGVGVLAVRNSNYVGMLGYYPRIAMEQGMLGALACNASPHVVPWGGRDKLLGTNPLAIGIPSSPPFLLDMSTSVVARSKIALARDHNEVIPKGWALDAEGRATSDPVKALRGGLLSQGPKGYGLGLLVDLLAGILPQAACGAEVKGLDFPDEFSNGGQVFLALNIGAFLPVERFRTRASDVLQRIKDSRAVVGVPEVLIPGERARGESDRRAQLGIPLDAGALEQLKVLFIEAGIEELLSDRPSVSDPHL